MNSAITRKPSVKVIFAKLQHFLSSYDSELLLMLVIFELDHDELLRHMCKSNRLLEYDNVTGEHNKLITQQPRQPTSPEKTLAVTDQKTLFLRVFMSERTTFKSVWL